MVGNAKQDRHSWSMTQKEKGMRETGVVMYGDERASTQQGNNHQISMTAFVHKEEEAVAIRQ